MRWLLGISPNNIFKCGFCETLVFRVCGARQNFNVFSFYHNPEPGDNNYESILTSMAALQAENVLASFLFMGDLNGHHQE